MSRHRLAPSLAIVGLLLGLAGSARAAGPDAAAGTDQSRTYRVPGRGTVVLDLPSGWRDSVRQPPQGLPPTIEFAPASGSDFSVLITILWKQSGGATTPEEIRKVVEASGTEALSGSVEKELKLQPLDGAEFAGLYYSLTDRTIKEGKRKEGEWRCMAQGSGSLGDLALTFTILTHSADAPERSLALAMLKGARRGEATEPAPPAAGSSLRKLTYPGKPWSLVMDLPGFQFDQRESSRDGTGLMVMGSNRETGLIISVYMEKAAKEGDAVSHDGVWVDVHLSKAKFDPDQWPLFEAVMDSAAAR
jgi:hypothetical protein